MRVRGNNYNSNYISFTISKDFTSTDNVIVKIEDGKYLVKTMSPYKYHDLPIANANGRLGIVTIGDNLTIDSSGKLSATSGLAATVTVGTTTTGEAGTDASVTNSGTAQAAVLNFVIPKGANGNDGSDGADGTDGREIELQVTDTYIQWRYIGDTTWYNLIALSELKGDKGDTGSNGQEVLLQVTDTYIQWKYANDTTWVNLIALDDLKGEPNTLSIGTVESGTSASANITGVAPNQTLNLVLPKGDTGSTPNIQVGNTTTLEAGSSATVTQRGTTENPIFDFGIPKGADGSGGGTSDYNELENKPVINLTSEDNTNPICLFDLEEGIYKLYGYIKYYPTYTGTAALTSPTLVTVQKSSTTTYIQMFEPYGNKIVGYEITSSSYIQTSFGKVVDNLTDNSTENAPSINAIKNQFMFNNTISNANDVNETGMFYTNSSTTNLPMTGSAGFLVSFGKSGTNYDKIQYWFRYRDKQVYCREYNKVNSNSDGTNKAWSDWEPSVLDKYSTKEQRIGTWIDGKPLYRKTFIITSISTGSNYITHNIDNLGDLINVYGNCLRKDGKWQPALRTDSTLLDWQIGVNDIGSTQFVLMVGSRYTNNLVLTKGNITLEYTKTTD